MTSEFNGLKLEDLAHVFALPDGAHINILQKCVICLERQGHSSPVKLSRHDLRQGVTAIEEIHIGWDLQSTPQMRLAYADMVESTADSAKGIAFLVMKHLGYDTKEQAPRGSRVDYFISKSEGPQDDTLIFNETIGLEISGILNGPQLTKARIEEKRERIEKQRGFRPSFIVVIEHSKPQAMIDMVC